MAARHELDARPDRRRTAALRGIYALVEPDRRPPEAYVEALLAGGVRLFQIRAKRGLAPQTLIAVVRRACAAGGLTIVNDDVDAALHADGVHLGQEDAARHDLSELRRRLGDGIIGLSCGTAEEARAADPGLIDYLGAGPLFATRSKPDAGLPIGPRGVRAVVEATRLPVAAIGGINLEGITTTRETGAAMAAIIAALASAADVAGAAHAFVDAWDAWTP